MLLEIIQNLCKNKGISLFKLEKDLGFGNGTIYKWDKSSPAVDKLKKVAEYFEVPINDLIYGDDDDIHTIAAHHDGTEWTEEELEEIERFKEFVKTKREQRIKE